MSNVAKLKKQAAELELKKQFDKALAIYIKLLETFDKDASELDVALFNRVGDLLLRQGNVADAVDYYEQAIDRYADTGFFNNAIALCNKVLRHSPGRASVYYKLGKISAQKGFKGDAKVNFLEYADRMQKAGRVDEAFRALKEFADLCPDQDEIRLTLAEQLTKADRKDEAIEQLQTLHEKYDAEGRVSEAMATANRMRAIDPTVEPRSSGGGRRKTTSGDLIFIDLDTPSPRASGHNRAVTPPPIRQAPPRIPTPPPASIPSPPASMLTPPASLLPESAKFLTPADGIPTPVSSIALPEIPSTTPVEPAIATPPAPIFEVPEPIFEAPRIVEELPTPISEASVAPFIEIPTPVVEASPETFVETPAASFFEPPLESIIEAPAPAFEPPAPVIPTPAAPISATPAAEFTPLAERQETPQFFEGPAFINESVDSGPLIEDPLPDITRVGSDSLGIEKSTPSASIFGLESTRLVADDIDETPPPSALIDVEPTALVEDTRPVHRSPTPTHAMLGQSVATGGDLEVEIPSEPTPTPSVAGSSIDFDLSGLTPPAEPALPHAAMRPTPRSSRVALEGLPLMDLNVPVTPSSSPRVASGDVFSLSGDLELLDGSIEPHAVPDESAAVVANADLEAAVDGALEPLFEATDDVAPLARANTATPADEESFDVENIELPTPSKARRSTIVAVQSVELLKASVHGAPENWGLHRELAEAMLEAGDRTGGIRELELAMSGAERSGDLDLASAIAEEVARLEPELVKHHQKRVEYAFRTNDRARLVEAYVSLADALLRSEQVDKARTVYQRVLDLAPDDVRAKAALDSMPVGVPEPVAPPAPPAGKRRSTISTPPIPAPASASSVTTNGFVNLGDWLRDTEAPKDTRMVVAEQEPTGDEDADFADMLRKFKQGVAENVDAEDYQSHYDLAIAFKEMGLLDEAIAEFQKALGSPTNRLPTFEALGQCFLEKGQPKLATSILSRALSEKASEDQLIGVLYLLGRAAEEQGNPPDAVTYYQRVFVLDIQFRDTADRLTELERATR